MTNREDINARMRASGWEVIDVEDGCYDVDGIVAAIEKAKQVKDKPQFINIRTIIGVGSAVAGQAVSHGAPFKADDVKNMKKMWDFDPEQSFIVPDQVRKFYADLPERGEKWVKEWNDLFASYKKSHPELGAKLEKRMKGELQDGWEDLIPKQFPDEPTPSRKSSGLSINPIAAAVDSVVVGTADLSPSVNLLYPNKLAFQHPSLQTSCGINGDYTGRYLHYGIRVSLITRP